MAATATTMQICNNSTAGKARGIVGWESGVQSDGGDIAFSIRQYVTLRARDSRKSDTALILPLLIAQASSPQKIKCSRAAVYQCSAMTAVST